MGGTIEHASRGFTSARDGQLDLKGLDSSQHTHVSQTPEDSRHMSFETGSRLGVFLGNKWLLGFLRNRLVLSALLHSLEEHQSFCLQMCWGHQRSVK